MNRPRRTPRGLRAALRRTRPPNATIAQPGLLAPESQIENGSTDPDAITIGAGTLVRGRLLTFPHAGSIEVGRDCYVGHRTEIWSAASVRIGDRVLIAHDVNIIDTSAHSMVPEDRHLHYTGIVANGLPSDPQDVPGVVSEPITLEDDVWISFGVIILRGVTIGRGSVIAAGSIVTHDVPPMTRYRMQVTPVMEPLE